jgi:hypothetical protein
MANVYAVKSGNWSDVTVWNTGALPTSADDVYANGYTIVADTNTTVLSIRSRSATDIVAGGGFTLVNGVTLEATNGFYSGALYLLTFSLTTGQECSIIGYIPSGDTNNGRTIYFNGNGTLNCVGDWEALGSLQISEALFVETTATGTVNLTGNIIGSGTVIRTLITVGGNFTLNLTGDVDYQVSAGNSIAGSIFSTNSSFTFNHVGRMLGGRIPAFTTTRQIYYNQTGAVISRLNNQNASNVAFNSTNTLSIHIMTGPFVCDEYGYMPFIVYRMNYKPTIGSYFEFRDNSTGGALPPTSPSPTASLVSPDTIVDAPIPANVRNGVTYALGTLTGTAYIPNSASVAYGVPVDNTTGVALLTGDSWIAAISSSNDPFAERLRNTATVQTTAAQIAAF